MLSYLPDEHFQMEVIQTTTFMGINKLTSAVTRFCNFLILILIQACKEDIFNFNPTSKEI